MSSLRPEEVIVDAALAKPRGERAAFLEQACGGNTELHQLAEALLSAHYLAAAANPTATRIPPTPAVQPFSAASDKPGDRIAEYKILQQIGEGGCGVVYMAEQEEPVRRRVALKVIKPGMDSKQVIARFEAERQALAMMDHVNIAKVLDAGTTAAGRPYFVMELVRGTRITEYCDQNNLSTAQRLALFLLVCKAIQHAHQKGIIHRDIKPSNILVTLHDGVPVPKVIAFGIAKAIEQRLTDKTVFTALDQFIGTPAYMSPEQAEMSGLDIDTRSDIYSLGVLLYELLTGKPPFEAKDLAGAGLDEMRRIIRERDPVLPSSRISTLDAAEQTTVARCRQVEPPKLIHLVRGDLDWIVMRCLEKDRGRRYETTNGLAMDIQRHLANEPVVARPASVAYRFRKMVRRNKVAVAAGTTVIAALIIGLGLSTWLFVKERAARKRATTAENDAQTVLDFFQEKVLAATRPTDQEGGLGREATILAAVNAAEPEIAKTFTNQPIVEASLRGVLATTYHYLGDFDLAIAQHEKELALFNKVLGPDDTNTLQTATSLAATYDNAGRSKEAISLLENVLKRDKVKLGVHHPETLTTMNNLAECYLGTDRLDEALVLFEAASKDRISTFGRNDPITLQVLHNLAAAYLAKGRLKEAIALYEDVLSRERARLGTNHPNTLTTLHSLASAYQQADLVKKAFPLHEEAVRLKTEKLGPEHPNTLLAINDLGMDYLADNRPLEAIPFFQKALDLHRSKMGNEHPHTISMMNNLAGAYVDSNQPSNALPLLEDLVRLGREKGEPNFASMGNLSQVYIRIGRKNDAQKLLEETLRLMKARVGLNEPNTLIVANNLGALYEDTENRKQAVALFEETLPACEKTLGPEHRDTLTALKHLAADYQAEGRLSEALPLFEKHLALATSKFGTNHSATITSRTALAKASLEAKHFEKTESLLLSNDLGLNQGENKSSPNGASRLSSNFQLLVQLYEAWGKPQKAEEWRGKLAASAAKGPENSADSSSAKK
jgi:eukaryotic-like serine/threonine-protein kinase